MRIAYCTTLRLPSERARAFQVAKVVEALRDNGHTVEIFCPVVQGSSMQTFESYYNLSAPIRLHYLGRTDPFHVRGLPAVLAGVISTMLFRRNLRHALDRHAREFDIVYTRSIELLPSLVSRRLPVILELDHIPSKRQRSFIRLLRRCRLIVALTSHLRQAVIEMGIASVPVIVEGDAVDLHDFTSLPSAEDTRESLGIPTGRPLIVYAGQLETMGLSRGVPELLSALRTLHARGLDFSAVIAGGPESARKTYEATVGDVLKNNIRFLGRIDHVKVPTLLSSADVLVYPAPESMHPFFLRDHSPLTMLEYMAAARPIVCADIAPLRDIVDETFVTFVPAGDPEALADAIRAVLSDRDSVEKKAQLLRSHVEQFTWERRMERIVRAAERK